MRFNSSSLILWLVCLSSRLYAFVEVRTVFNGLCGAQKGKILSEFSSRIYMAGYRNIRERDERHSPQDCNWRMFNVEVRLSEDPGKDVTTVHEALLASVVSKLDVNVTTAELLQNSSIKVVRKSFDARARTINTVGQPVFSYTVDIVLNSSLASRIKLRPAEGRFELISPSQQNNDGADPSKTSLYHGNMLTKADIVVVGSGPAGLFSALALSEAGFRPIIIERGQPVETRGRDIGALFHRSVLNEDSNLWYLICTYNTKSLTYYSIATGRAARAHGVMESSRPGSAKTAMQCAEYWRLSSGTRCLWHMR